MFMISNKALRTDRDHVAFEDGDFREKAHRLAKYLADSYLDITYSPRPENADECSVTALCGAWGSGKTSFLNLVVQELDTILPRWPGDRRRPPFSGSLDDDQCKNRQILYFNPWLFNSREMILREFFDELEGKYSSQLLSTSEESRAEASVGRLISEYGTAFLTDAGMGIADTLLESSPAVVRLVAKRLKSGRLTETIEKHRAKHDETSTRELLSVKRARLREELSDSKVLPRLVIIDNVDRLADPEIQELFRFIGSTLDLPKIHFLISFDRDIVVKSLDKIQGAGGETYLDKLVDQYLHLPQITLTDIVYEFIISIPKSDCTDDLDNKDIGNLSRFIAALVHTTRGFNRLKASYEEHRVLRGPAEGRRKNVLGFIEDIISERYPQAKGDFSDETIRYFEDSLTGGHKDSRRRPSVMGTELRQQRNHMRSDTNNEKTQEYINENFTDDHEKINNSSIPDETNQPIRTSFLQLNRSDKDFLHEYFIRYFPEDNNNRFETFYSQLIEWCEGEILVWVSQEEKTPGLDKYHWLWLALNTRYYVMHYPESNRHLNELKQNATQVVSPPSSDTYHQETAHANDDIGGNAEKEVHFIGVSDRIRFDS